MDIISQLCKDLGLQKWQIENSISLFEEGATIPFVARYRKERTGSLNETQLRDILHKYTYYKELDERRKTILESIKSQGKLTDELKKKIENTISKVELEDLYLPYKPKRLTRGKKAVDAGLEPLAEYILNLQDKNAIIEEYAKQYLNDKAKKAGFDTLDKIIKGACDIIAEKIADDADTRKYLRELAWEKGVIRSFVRKDFADKKTKFNMYYDYSESVKEIPSHRILGMFRGEREKVLRLELIMPDETVTAYLENKIIKYPQSASADLLKKTIDDAFFRLLSSATETEIRKLLKEKAEEEAFKVFEKNLRTVLLAPPAGAKATIGIDPGFRTGCKVVAVDNTGKLLENHTIYPTEPKNDYKGSAAVIKMLINKYKIELIAIGNGTACRETFDFVKKVLEDYDKDERPVAVIVNESGASVYSASEVAIKEFPDYDVTVRGAVSIARRLQDPLSELVKIDPKSIGVGQYQHDVNQVALKKHLEEVVESCVNSVGVDLNLASEELLKYVSGLNKKIAEAIVKYRNENGAFESRADILKVSGLGEKIFEQSAGFLRIRNGKNPLDNSAVHPERYSLVENIAKKLNTNVESMIGNYELLSSVNKNDFVSEDVGLPTIEDIFKELEKPGRDPRESFKYASFDDNIKEVEDLKPGMVLEGTVTNVTNFGAFVDIGVHQDGLVHISELSDSFVSDPTEVVKTGDIVKVRVLEVDTELKRISLSMKSETNKMSGQKRTADKNHSQNKEKKIKTIKPKFSIKQLMR